MKIKSFKGKGIRGYMDFDITFNEGVSFLIGINGSGKTTVLKLISGLITPSFIDLFQIEFREIEIIVENRTNNTNVRIKCVKNRDQLTLSYDKEKTVIPILTKNYRAELLPEYVFDRFRNDMMRFEEDQVVKKIKELKTPLFLGLNRRTIEHLNNPDIDRFQVGRRRTSNMDMFLDSDYFDRALNDIQELFNNAILNNTQSQYQLHNRFRIKVFGESFTISEVPTNNNAPIDYSLELKKLEKREQDYNNAMELLGLSDIEKKSKDFFDKIKASLSTLKNTSSLDSNNKININYYNALMNWMMNSEQLNRTDRIIKYANEYSESIQKLKEPFTRFVEAVNVFFSEGGKQIKVEDSGEIKILIQNNKKKTNSIYELSSGEKQLIIILAHVAFYKKINQQSAPIFIIDEPELSLHISWQEKFVDALLQANPDTQFILATHAPSIIAKKERKTWCIDLTK